MPESAASMKRSGDQLIVDVDVHVNDTPGALAPYCEQPWRKSLEILAAGPQRYLDIPGYSPTLRVNPPVPGGQKSRSVNTAKAMRTELDSLGIDYGILLPDYLLFFAGLPNIDYANCLFRAYNRWLTAEWLEKGNGLFGALMVCPQDPEESVREIERYAGTPGICSVYLPTAGINPLWGHRRYDKILATCEAVGLPVIFHSVTVVSPAFPTNMEQFENQFGRQVLGHAFAMMANMTSLMHTGVPERYPNLKIVFTEAGLSWVPLMMWRMDKYHQEMRRVVPVLKLRPSEYIKRQMWFATQPLEEPDNPRDLVETIEHFGGAERVMFASDWPHHDFDHPTALSNVPLDPEQRRKILWGNAVDVFKLPPPPVAASKERAA